MKKVISIVLNPFTNDSRVLKENITLLNAGYDVEILALFKDGIDGLKEQEDVQGINVRRLRRNPMTNIKTKTTQKENIKNEGRIKWFVRVTFNIIKKVLKLFGVNLSLYKLFIQFAKEAKGADIIHCNDLYTLPMGVIVKKFYNKDVKIVYDAHEFETEVNGLKGRKKLFKKILEKLTISYADKVITVSDAIANEYAKMYNIEKPALVLNTPNYQKIDKKNIFREELGIKDNQTIFLYQGGFSKNRGIEILVDTFKNIKDPNSVIIFMGYGPLEDFVQESAKEYNNIYFYPAVTPDVLLDYTCSADFGILFYENNCLNHYYCSPNKMFEYLMAEIPVIASSLYEMKRLVENNSIGIVANENTSEGLQDAIENAVVLDKVVLQENIQKVKKVYNWEEQEKVLLDVYNGLY